MITGNICGNVVLYVYMIWKQGGKKNAKNSRSCMTSELESFFLNQVRAISSTYISHMPFESLGIMPRTSRTSHGKFSTTVRDCPSFLFPHTQDQRVIFVLH